MTLPSSAAEQLDRAVDRVLSGDPPSGALEAGLRPLVEVAGMLRAALVPVPASGGFEARLAARLVQGPQPLAEGMRALEELLQRQLRHPARLLLTGAVSSAALGVGVTAYAVWRARHPAGIGHRLVHR